MTVRERDRNAARRLAILRHAREVTGNVSRTCRYYGITRQAYYTWLRRYEELAGWGPPPPTAMPRITRARRSSPTRRTLAGSGILAPS